MQSTPISLSFDSMSNESPDSIRNLDCDLSMMSGEKTVLSTVPSALKSKRRAKLEINPSRLQFESSTAIFSNSIIMGNESENMETEGTELSSLRDVQGIRHLDEDRCDQMDGSVAECQTLGNTALDSKFNPSTDFDSSNEPCFTPTGCFVAPWDQALCSAMSASPTPLLSRPLKKMHFSHHESERIDTIVEANEGTIMDREDFTKLFREASNLDYQSHYEYGTLLGRGHFGEVWSVRHTRSGKLFALKKSIHRFRGRRDRNLFIREINCVADLKPHKNIVRYDRAWQDSGHYFIVMELCTGGTLRGLIDKEGFISLNRIRMLMHGFLSGLELLDAHNLIHLDLKPDNLFLSDDGGLKIGDFGLCHPASEWDADEGDGAYIAPEVLNEKPTSAADIFSAGLILFQMLVGIPRLPRQGSEWRRVRSGEYLFAEIPPARETDSDMESFWKDLTELSSSMLAVCCSDRPHARDCLMSICFSSVGAEETALP